MKKLKTKKPPKSLKEQVAILKSRNTKLVKYIRKVDKQQNDFMRVILPKAFEYMHDTYGQNDKFSPETYSQMAINILNIKTLEFKE